MKLLTSIVCLISLSLYMMAQDIIVVRRARAPAGGSTTVTFGDFIEGSGDVDPVAGIFNSAPTAGNAVVVQIWHLSGTTITSVCDGTGTNGCTGSSTYTSTTSYDNGGVYETQIWYTCNFTGSTNLSIVGGNTQLYIVGSWASGNTTTGTNCNDGAGPKNNQSTGGSTAYSGGAITTTNAHSLVLGLAGNVCGSSAVTAGTDGQGNSMTQAGNQADVEVSQYRNETATNTYTPTMTGPNCAWNMQTFAIK